MRIQHNIMAMSAYRNYTNNVSAMKKNLEKLSSGYKINRAGDDAAGLAISEKMRAQITGLETAQKNAKDGISLVQTAEGALTEVHDMLNRMVELATQSANGTYDNTTDRAQMQKELNQLRSEINRIADSSNFNGIKLFDGSMEADKVTYEVTGGADLGILDPSKATNDLSKYTASTIIHQDGVEAKKTKFYVELDNVTMVSNNADTANYKVSVGGTGLTVALAKDTALTGKDLVDNILAQAGNDEIVISGVTYAVTGDGTKLVFEMTDDAFDKLKNDSTNAGKAKFSGDFAVTLTRKGAPDGTVNMGTQIVTEGGPRQGALLANTMLKDDLTKTDIVDGTTFTIGNTSYVYTTKEETLNAVKEAGSNFVAIDISDLVDKNGALDDKKAPHAQVVAGTGGALSEALTRLTRAAKDNEMFTVGARGGSKLTFQEKSTYGGNGKNGKADLTTGEGIQAQIQKGTFSKVTTKAANGDGKGLTLQIGDTADSYNQLKVSLQDMHVKSLGIDGISIASQADAATAVDAIKAAINTVSDVRGTLGATQNRLDHTINNLSVMTENIQDAESTIRDVDIAEEMMAYTKNNILIQSAQAMLAQANQVPQGVLQLLQ